MNNKVSDCHGAEMIWRYSTLPHPAVQKSPIGSGYFSCKKCHKPCTPVEAKKEEDEAFDGMAKIVGNLSKLAPQPREDREVGQEKKTVKCPHGTNCGFEYCTLDHDPAPRPTEGVKCEWVPCTENAKHQESSGDGRLVNVCTPHRKLLWKQKQLNGQ